MLAFHFARSRRHVCETNLRLCFPELSEHELQQLLRKTFESNGIGFIEIVIAWVGNPERYQHLANFHGLDNLKTAAAQGKGVLLIGPHLTTFEMAGFLYSGVGELNATYRANDKNPCSMRLCLMGDTVRIRACLSAKRYGAPCAALSKVACSGMPRIRTTAQSIRFLCRSLAILLLRLPRAAALLNSMNHPCFFSHYRRPDNSGYDIYFSEVLTDYPSGNDEEDGRIINRLVEAAIRRQPDQYLWLHKRFKTPHPAK